MTCPHRFARFRPWPVRRRWVCILCGLVTRHYDGVDRMGTRPVHAHMSVAYRGFNTEPRS